MLARRIIPCLDVKNDQVVKGVKFRDHVVVGEIEALALYYQNTGADELVFYDITASCENRHVDVTWVTRVAKILNIPFCVAGGIDSVEIAKKILAAGADKISINTPAIKNPELINQLSLEFGRQCVVVGIDSCFQDSDYYIYQMTGDPEKTLPGGIRTEAWIKEVQERGAGEIVLNCMNQDGMRQGYDIVQLSQMIQYCKIPLIASGGAGSSQDFIDVFKNTQVSGALAASIFHDGTLCVSALKEKLIKQNIEVRK